MRHKRWASSSEKPDTKPSGKYNIKGPIGCISWPMLPTHVNYIVRVAHPHIQTATGGLNGFPTDGRGLMTGKWARERGLDAVQRQAVGWKGTSVSRVYVCEQFLLNPAAPLHSDLVPLWPTFNKRGFKGWAGTYLCKRERNTKRVAAIRNLNGPSQPQSL